MMTVLAATRPCHQGKTLSGPHAVAPPYKRQRGSQKAMSTKCSKSKKDLSLTYTKNQIFL